jgi:hypothetical protein
MQCTKLQWTLETLGKLSSLPTFHGTYVIQCCLSLFWMSFSSYSTKAYCYQMMSILVTLNFHLCLSSAWGSHYRHHHRQLCRALPTLKSALVMTPKVLWGCWKHVIFKFQLSILSEILDPSCPLWESSLWLDCWLLWVLVDSCLSWICSAEICDIVLCSWPRQNILHKFTRWTSVASVCI